MNDRVLIAPEEPLQRRSLSCHGLTVETAGLVHRQPVELRFRAGRHLLAFREQGSGPGAGKFSFVPAGCAYHERQQPGVPARFVFFYIDPSHLPQSRPPGSLLPKLSFEDAALLDTVLKFKKLTETPGPTEDSYLRALTEVLLHELAHAGSETLVRGGLAAWQQRVVTGYIEDHLVEPIPIGALAQLVDLSPYHFCRAFKQSFGMPPHRYHTHRRIERAKALLLEPAGSITDIGLALGFSATSSFSTVFHKAAGETPMAYRRRCSAPPAGTF
jgi:AraC family transcriptional regulator